MSDKCSSNQFCNSLGEKTRCRLCDKAVITKQKRKQDSLANRINYLEIVVQGVLIVSSLADNDSPKSFELMGSGDLFGVINVFDPDAPTEYRSVALTDVVKCKLPASLIKELFYTDSQFSQALMQNLTHRLNFNNTYWMKMNSLNTINKIFYLADCLADMGININDLTHEDIATIISMTRVTVTRTMKHLYNRPARD